jgi:hypothetical protein
LGGTGETRRLKLDANASSFLPQGVFLKESRGPDEINLAGSFLAGTHHLRRELVGSVDQEVDRTRHREIERKDMSDLEAEQIFDRQRGPSMLASKVRAA